MILNIDNNSIYFSIIIPVFNRATLIVRAINSCLNQDFNNFEIIVVDDGSTDGTAVVVEDFTDSRLRLVRHQSNRGVCPARNTGISVCKGEWVLCLDSDDELPPGALATMYQRTREIGEDVAAIRFMCQLDSGELSPDPPLIEDIWDYQAFISFWESCLGRRQETQRIARSETYKHVRFPENRGPEAKYHLDFAKLFLIKTYPDVLRIYHQDAGNTITRPSVQQILTRAPDLAKNMEMVLDQHGSDLIKWAPKLYRQNLAGSVTLHLLSGQRIQALRYFFKYLSIAPITFKLGLILFVGFIGKRPLAWLKAYASKRAKR